MPIVYVVVYNTDVDNKVLRRYVFFANFKILSKGDFEKKHRHAKFYPGFIFRPIRILRYIVTCTTIRTQTVIDLSSTIWSHLDDVIKLITYHSKHDIWRTCFFRAGQSFATLVQHEARTVWICRVCWEIVSRPFSGKLMALPGEYFNDNGTVWSVTGGEG